MKRTGCIVAAALLLGLLLAGITGYFIWHSGQDKYVRAEMAGASEGVGIAGAEEPVQEETGGAGGVANPDSVQGTDGPDAADGGLSDAPNGVKEQDPETGTEDKDPPLQFVFAGDILLSDHVLNAYQKAGNIGGVVDSGFRQVIDASDIFMANEEFPFSTRGTPAEDKQFTFRVAPSTIFVFKELGIDIVTLANNHAIDYGTDALLDTCDTLDEAGISRVGAGKNLDEAKAPVILEAQGKKIGFLGASRVIPVGSWNATSTKPGMLTTYDPKILVDEIKKLRSQCDYLVVYVHWGIERKETPEDYQRSLGKQYIDAGADIVIGSHPHVLQGVEYYKGKPVVYSLGNFIFGSSIPKTALLKVQWDGEDSQLTFVPGTSSAGYTRVLENADQKADFASYMTGISYGVTVEKDGNVVPQQ